MSARILAVDDTPPNLRLLEALLAKDGYEVVTASSGEEALRAIAEPALGPSETSRHAGVAVVIGFCIAQIASPPLGGCA